jgi:hypothetical protein
MDTELYSIFRTAATLADMLHRLLRCSHHAFEDAAGGTGGEQVPHLAPDLSMRSSRSMQIVLAGRLQGMVEGRGGREIGQLGNG